MLFWLDGRLNTKARPQENFAREVMELFTIGVGQFTEEDVYAGARVFTGWNLQRIGDARDPLGFYQFFFNGAQHDTSAKTFSFPIYADGSKTIPARAESAACRMASICSPRSRAIPRPRGAWRGSSGRFSSARSGRPTRLSSPASRMCTARATVTCRLWCARC